MNELTEVDFLMADEWRVFAPMTPDEVQDLIELIDTHDRGKRRHNRMALDGWGAQAALGEWTADLATQAVNAYYAQYPLPVWPDDPDNPESGHARPVMPADINAFIARARGELP